METERLVLEPLVPAHAAELFSELGHPSLYLFIPRDPPASVEALERRYAALATRRSPDGSEAWLNWVARLRGTGEPVGLLEATVRADESLLAYSIFPRSGRQGYAREGCRRVVEHLFVDQAAPVVVAEIDARNLASIRLVEALGFTRTRFTKDADFFKGASSDEVRYELRPR